MFQQVLSGQTKRALAILGESGLLKSAHLAGGTALALRIGHRVSLDLDFFTPKQFNAQLIAEKFQALPTPFKLDRLEENTLLGFLDKAKFSLFFSVYPLIDKIDKYLGVNVASLKDIAAMKLAAISQRGTKRDFIDLYFIIAIEKLITFEDIFDLYDKKFNLLKQNKAHLINSLTYFSDAEGTTVPRMFNVVSWREVKKFFEKETSHFMKDLIRQEHYENRS
ncbi:MAG: nucleotidyl transferase AbiEii/AbiGii toxin family protein [bacterium]|nr:nucleotidyl transferase AbiEii/AbiGii toxin family protein [bacterium]